VPVRWIDKVLEIALERQPMPWPTTKRRAAHRRGGRRGRARGQAQTGRGGAVKH
jgi:hypothetical protein